MKKVIFFRLSCVLCILFAAVAIAAPEKETIPALDAEAVAQAEPTQAEPEAPEAALPDDSCAATSDAEVNKITFENGLVVFSPELAPGEVTDPVQAQMLCPQCNCNTTIPCPVPQQCRNLCCFTQIGSTITRLCR